MGYYDRSVRACCLPDWGRTYLRRMRWERPIRNAIRLVSLTQFWLVNPNHRHRSCLSLSSRTLFLRLFSINDVSVISSAYLNLELVFHYPRKTFLPLPICYLDVSRLHIAYTPSVDPRACPPNSPEHPPHPPPSRPSRPNPPSSLPPSATDYSDTASAHGAALLAAQGRD
jgi:hypothetical protein